MIKRIHRENYGVYGARKIWHELHRRGVRGRPDDRELGGSRFRPSVVLGKNGLVLGPAFGGAPRSG
ncbi:IS3 family transposase [Dactylosporangium sp. NPDC050588]|uniref:IS3 family transposase n=1 Tax=Dactylosporangium sp. NPDC050588 TaxID=3157211 RepID=UPI00340FBF8B